MKGYASEAAQRMVEYAFKELRLKRVIATTEYSILASQNVMRKIGDETRPQPITKTLMASSRRHFGKQKPAWEDFLRKRRNVIFR